MAYNFNKEEIQEIKDNMSKITTHIPDNLTTWIWDTYKKISGSTEPKPCSCPSSAKLWKKSVDTINSFLKSYGN